MGKISEIPRLRKVLAERMAKLGGEGIGMSDAAAERSGLLDSPLAGPAALKRLGNALNKALTERLGSMSYGAPTVVLLPPGGQAQVVTPQGRGPVQVNIREPGAPARPTDVPKHVAQAYAEAAAASYGVTPAVVQAKRALRFLRREAASRVRAALNATPDSPFITSEVRAERRPIGREVIAYDDPADLMLADAEG